LKNARNPGKVMVKTKLNECLIFHSLGAWFCFSPTIVVAFAGFLSIFQFTATAGLAVQAGLPTLLSFSRLYKTRKSQTGLLIRKRQRRALTAL
jgi:hypothetical protein